MLERDLMVVAKAIAYDASSAGLLRDAMLRTAVSRSYYALFHALARSSADALIGGEGSDRTNRAWHQAYRSLDHLETSKACERCVRENADLGFPPAVLTFARLLPSAMRQRHLADYDPTYVPNVESVGSLIAATDKAVNALRAISEQDRRAFAAYILFDRGRRNIARSS